MTQPNVRPTDDDTRRHIDEAFALDGIDEFQRRFGVRPSEGEIRHQITQAFAAGGIEEFRRRFRGELNRAWPEAAEYRRRMALYGTLPPPTRGEVWMQRLRDTAAYLFAGALIFLMALFLSGYMPRNPNL